MTSQIGDNENGSSSGSSFEKTTIRLFGFELNPCNNYSNSVEGDESVNSSNTMSYNPAKEKRSAGETDETKKFECQYCFKEFANSQALGGHQNAHKKERMKKKRLQFQARRASLNYYLQPFQSSFSGSGSPVFYDPSSFTTPNQFTLYEEEPSQISFNPYNQQDKLYALQPPMIHFQQQDSSMFKPSLPRNKRSCKSLDLSLGLDVHQSTVQRSTRSET